MKTLVMLTALATIALAAPAQQDNDFKEAANAFQGHLRTPYYYMKREKKSPKLSSDTIMNNEASIEDQTDPDTSASTGRNTFKKPIFIKKKVDYHIYRDSDEETMNTDSTEICGRHLKLKLCADEKKFRELLKNSEISKMQRIEQEIKQSLIKAKDAVENLQRDFNKMEKGERNDTIKQEDKNQTNLVEDDLKVAKQMLQHLEDQLEDLNDDRLQLRNIEEFHNGHLLSALPEETMTQWKNIMSNHQNDAELATNIEDSFRSSHSDTAIKLLLNQKENKTKQLLENNTTEASSNHQRMSLAYTDDHKRSLSDHASIEHLHDVQNRREQQLEDDMSPSASENIQMKSINIENHHTLISENQEKLKNALEDVSGMHDTPFQGIVEDGVFAKNSMSDITATETLDSKKQEQSFKHKDEDEKFIKDTSFKNSENNQERPIDSHESNFQLNDFKDHFMQDLTKNLQAKTVENMIGNNKKENTLEDFKLRDHMEKSHASNEFVQKSIVDNMKEKSVLKSAETPHHRLHNIVEKNENFINVADQTEQARIHISDHKDMSSKMKSTEEALETSTRNNFVETHKNLMKSLDLDLRERNNIQNIDYNETEREETERGKMKSSDDHLTDFFKIGENQHGGLIKTSERDSCENSDEDESETNMRSVENSSIKSLNHESDHLQTQLNVLHKANQLGMTINDHSQQEEKKIQNQFELTKKSLISNVKSAEEPWRHHLSSLKSTEDHMHHHFHHADAMHNAHWGHENRPMSSMKAVGEHVKEFHGYDHRNPHFRENQHMPSKMRAMHDENLLDHVHANLHAAARHHNMNSHSNIHDTDVTSGGKIQSHLHASMRDAMDSLESDHMFRWLPSHEVPRYAYGSGGGGGAGGSSSSGGAVGVFPNANTGACGIPLLLSCSPSVVSGSLAKPHTAPPPSYSPPSYKTEDDFGFHNKRDVKKTSEGVNTNVLRSTAVKQKAMTMKT